MAEILMENIKTLRARTGLNQTLFGELHGVGQSTVARWEKGAEPEGPNLTSLAEMAGCTIKELTTQLLPKLPPAMPPRLLKVEGGTLYLPVQLPSEDDLMAMFEALLAPLKNETDRHVIARRLAQTLPNGLAQTVARQSRQGTGTSPPDTLHTGAAPRDPANHGS